MQGVYALLLHRFIAGDLAPGVEELIGGKQAAHFVIHPVADNAQGVKHHQLRDIPPIAHSQLAVGVVNGGLILTDRTFKFKHHQGQTVDIENGIGNAAGLPTFDLQLVDQFVDIAVFISIRSRKVDQMNMDVLFLDAIFTHLVRKRVPLEIKTIG